MCLQLTDLAANSPWPALDLLDLVAFRLRNVQWPGRSVQLRFAPGFEPRPAPQVSTQLLARLGQPAWQQLKILQVHLMLRPAVALESTLWWPVR